MLLVSKFLPIMDLEMKKIRLVMCIDLSQRNQNEISLNMSIMMERFLDSLQDLTLKFQKMLTDDSLSHITLLMTQFQYSNQHKRIQELLRENS